MIRRPNQLWGIWRNWNVMNRNLRVNAVLNLNYSVNTDSPRKTAENIASPLTYNILGEPRKTVPEDETRQYYSLIPSIINDLTDLPEQIPEVIERYKIFLEYNLPIHFHGSGLSVVSAYKAFESIDNLTPTNIDLSHILGWCVDILLSRFRLNNEFIYGTETRLGLACWHKLKGVGVNAMNDSITIEEAPFFLLRKYFSGHSAYIHFMETFHGMNLKIAMGTSLELMHRKNLEPHIKEFTIHRFKALAKYRATYAELLLPIKLAMHFANKYNTETYKIIKEVMIKLGEYFTAQNDILDCYGDPSITGKDGNDICEGKCTWLVVNALERATQAQEQLLKKHYGITGSENEFKIRTLYEEMGILQNFLIYENESYKIICEDVNKMPKNVPREFFTKLVDVAYGRY